MPGYDRTGPQGAGPMTGGGFGYCGNAGRAGAGNAGGFYGAGRRGGGGGRMRMGRRGGGGGQRFAGWQGAPADNSYADDIGQLEERARRLEAELDAIQSRLAAVKNPETD